MSELEHIDKENTGMLDKENASLPIREALGNLKKTKQHPIKLCFMLGNYK